MILNYNNIDTVVNIKLKKCVIFYVLNNGKCGYYLFLKDFVWCSV